MTDLFVSLQLAVRFSAQSIQLLFFHSFTVVMDPHPIWNAATDESMYGTRVWSRVTADTNKLRTSAFYLGGELSGAAMPTSGVGGIGAASVRGPAGLELLSSLVEEYACVRSSVHVRTCRVQSNDLRLCKRYLHSLCSDLPGGVS